MIFTSPSSRGSYILAGFISFEGYSIFSRTFLYEESLRAGPDILGLLFPSALDSVESDFRVIILPTIRVSIPDIIGPSTEGLSVNDLYSASSEGLLPGKLEAGTAKLPDGKDVPQAGFFEIVGGYATGVARSSLPAGLRELTLRVKADPGWPNELPPSKTAGLDLGSFETSRTCTLEGCG